MANARECRSLRSDFNLRRSRRGLAPIPRMGDRRGMVADLAPPKEGRPARAILRSRQNPLPESVSRVNRGARTLLTMSVIFNWFGL